ncbi:MAG: arginine--tRNA ligase, partial [bacterium]
MTSPASVLQELLQTALVAAFGEEYADTDPVLRPSQFADFQANVALALAKRLGRPPREVADEVVAHL